MARNQVYPAAQATGVLTVTPDDSVNLVDDSTNNPGALYAFGALYVGGAGNISLVMVDGTTKIFIGVAAGTFLPIAAKRVNSTNTTATNMLWLVSK